MLAAFLENRFRIFLHFFAFICIFCFLNTVTVTAFLTFQSINLLFQREELSFLGQKSGTERDIPRFAALFATSFSLPMVYSGISATDRDFHMTIARSIDVGFGQVKYTTKDYDDDCGCQVFPSIAATATGQVKVAGGMFAQDNVVNVDVDGKTFTVGPDAISSVSGSFVRNIDDAYSRSNDYMALLRGALYYIREPEIEWLVVGLPMSTYMNDSIRESLRERIVGAHTLPNFHSAKNRTSHPNVSVRVAHCRVVPQPVGTFFNYAIPSGEYEAMQEQTNLVIDIGHGTVDWFVSVGKRPEHARCGAYAGGMSRIIAAVAAQMGDRLQNNIKVQTIIDRAIRNKTVAQINGQEIDILAQYKTVIADEVRKSVKAMLVGIEDFVDIQNIFVTGGGTALWRDILQEEIPREMFIDKDPVFSNVRGFQLLAEQLTNPVTA